MKFAGALGGFPKLGVPFLGVPILRTIVFGVLHWVPLFGETTTSC